MPSPGPWIQAPDQRLGKMIIPDGLFGPFKQFGGLVDSDGTPHIDAFGLAALDSITLQEVLGAAVAAGKPRFTGDYTVDQAKGIRDYVFSGLPVAYGSPLYIESVATYYNAPGFDGGTGTTRAVGELEESALFGPALQYENAVGLTGAQALVTESDNYDVRSADPEWGNPKVVGAEWHPDDVPSMANRDFGIVNDSWVSVAWKMSEAETSDSYTPVQMFAAVTQSALIAQDVDAEFYNEYPRFTGWGAPSVDIDLGSFSTPTSASLPDPDVTDYGIFGQWHLSTAQRIDNLVPQSIEDYVFLPVIYYNKALTDDGENWLVGAKFCPPARRTIMDFDFTPARYRFIYDTVSPAPPLRLFPRDDDLAVGGGRLYPPPQSQQRGVRTDGYF